MWRADAVNVRRAIRNREVARIHHPQINVKRLPELSRASCPRFCPFFPALIRPTLLDFFATLHIFAPVFVKAANIWFEPWVEHCCSHVLQKLAHPITPAQLFLHTPERYEIHRAREVHSCALEQAA